MIARSIHPSGPRLCKVSCFVTVETYYVVFLVMTPCSLVRGYHLYSKDGNSISLRNVVRTYPITECHNLGHYKWPSISSTFLLGGPIQTLLHLFHLFTVHVWWMNEEGERAAGCLGAHLWTVWSVFCLISRLVRRYVFLIMLGARKILLSSTVILAYLPINCRKVYTNWKEGFKFFS